MIDEIKKILKPINADTLKLRNFGNFILSKHFSYFTNNVYTYICDNNISFEQSLANVGKLAFIKSISPENANINNDNIVFNNLSYDNLNPQHDIEKNLHLRDTNIIAKINLNGHEYDFLKKFQKTIARFSQVVIQFHDLTHSYHYNFSHIDPEQLAWQNKIDILHFMNEHFDIINISPNNNFIIKDGLPDVLKVTFLRKDMSGLLNKNLLQPAYPSREIDIAENQSIPDIEINWWI